MGKTCRASAQNRLDRLRDNLRADSVKGRFFFINIKEELFLVILHIPVYIDYTSGLLKNSFNFTGYFPLSYQIGAIDLCHKGAQNRGTRRYLHHLYTSSVLVAQFFDLRP